MHTVRSPDSPRFLITGVALAILTVASAMGGNALADPVGGDSFDAASAVAAIVKVPKPWYAPRFIVARRMRAAIPDYQALPGLAFKYFSFAQADGDFGGIYLWKDLPSARAWFSPAWFSRVRKERGSAAQVRFFEVVAAIDNTPGGTPANSRSSAVATLAHSPIPPGADKAGLVSGFQSAMNTDRGITGLLRRYYVLTDQGEVGTISLWRDSASARRWFDGLKQSTPASAVAASTVEWFDTPILLPGMAPGNQPRIPGLSSSPRHEDH